MSDHCQSCQAEVIFVSSATSGKPMILDAKPEKRVVLGHELPSTEDHASALVLDAATRCSHATARVVNVYTDHHVTCPKAADWRGKTRRTSSAGRRGGRRA